MSEAPKKIMIDTDLAFRTQIAITHLLANKDIPENCLCSTDVETLEAFVAEIIAKKYSIGDRLNYKTKTSIG